MTSPRDRSLPADSAQDSLQYIRRTLDAAGRLSSVSGSGMMVVGALALGAVWLNLRVTGTPWQANFGLVPALTVWAALLVISATVTAAFMSRKAEQAGQLFWSPILRKALDIGAAPLLLGGVLSGAMLYAGRAEFLPMIWLGCYGAALTSAGAISVSPVRWLGISFLSLAAVAAFLPAASGLALLATGFGGLHLSFGAYIHWRRDE